MNISIELSRLFSKKFIEHLEAKHKIECLGDVVAELDLDTEDGVIGFYDYAPTSEWSSHATRDTYGDVPYAVVVSFGDQELTENLVWELTKAIETMVQEKDETLIEYINE